MWQSCECCCLCNPFHSTLHSSVTQWANSTRHRHAIGRVDSTPALPSSRRDPTIDWSAVERLSFRRKKSSIESCYHGHDLTSYKPRINVVWKKSRSVVKETAIWLPSPQQPRQPNCGVARACEPCARLHLTCTIVFPATPDTTIGKPLKLWPSNNAAVFTREPCANHLPAAWKDAGRSHAMRCERRRLPGQSCRLTAEVAG